MPLINTRLRANENVRVEAWDQGGKTRLAVGRVATLDNAIDASTDTIKVKALFANTDDALYPNQAVSVILQLDTLTDALAVPPAAVLRGAQGFYVYVVNADSSVSTRVVKPGPVDGNWMAVEGPLQPGDKVVIDGADRLRDGAKVEVIASDPKQRPGASAAGAGGARHAGRAAQRRGQRRGFGCGTPRPTSPAASARAGWTAAARGGREAQGHEPRGTARLVPEAARGGGAAGKAAAAAEATSP